MAAYRARFGFDQVREESCESPNLHHIEDYLTFQERAIPHKGGELLFTGEVNILTFNSLGTYQIVSPRKLQYLSDILLA